MLGSDVLPAGARPEPMHLTKQRFRPCQMPPGIPHQENAAGSSAGINSPPYGKPPAPLSHARDFQHWSLSPISGPAISSTIAASAEQHDRRRLTFSVQRSLWIGGGIAMAVDPQPSGE